MPSRSYRLEPVLRYRRVLTDEALGQLAALELQRSLITHRIDRIGDRRSQERAALAGYQAGEELDALLMRRHQDVMDHLAREEARERGRLCDIETLIAAQRTEVTDRRRQQETLQVLKDRFQENLRREERRAETHSNDEIASMMAAREVQA